MDTLAIVFFFAAFVVTVSSEEGNFGAAAVFWLLGVFCTWVRYMGG